MTTDGSGRYASPHYAWGIYLDGYASGYHVHHNVVANNAYGGVFIHGGDRNVIENNVFLNGTYYQLCLGTGLNPDMKDNKIVRNVFYYTGEKAILYCCLGSAKPKPSNTIDSNLCYHKGLPLEVACYGGPTGADSWNDWKAAGFDSHSLIADPLFRDLGNGDYRSKQPDLGPKLGFEQIDLSRVGLKGYRTTSAIRSHREPGADR
jgi:parallel beta-helix repeat protein